MISNIQWQEWSFRVGCWLLVLLGHLWLLLVNPATPVFSSTTQSGTGSSELSLSFVQAKSTTTHGNSTAIEPSAQANKEPSAQTNKEPSANKKASVKVSKEAASIKKRLTNQANANGQAKTQKSNLENSTEKTPAEEKLLGKHFKSAEITNETVDQISGISSSDAADDQQQEQMMDRAVDEMQDKSPSSPAIETTIYKPLLAAPPVPPRYPEIARNKKQQGTVWLDIFLDDNGEQKQLIVHQSSGVSVLDKAALAAVKQWRFSQFQKDYQAHLVKIRIPIEFSLN
jgi:periplasmic protein TonB